MDSPALSLDFFAHGHESHAGMLSTEPLGDAQQFQAAFDHAAVGIFQSTPSGGFVRVNPALAHLLGYATPRDVADKVNDLERQLYVNPGDREQFVRTINANGAIMNFETQCFRQDGTIIWVSINAWLVRNDAGQIQYYEGFVEDISEPKRSATRHKINASLGDVNGLLDRLSSTPLSPQQHRYVREARVLVDSALLLIEKAQPLLARFSGQRYNSVACPLCHG